MQIMLTICFDDRTNALGTVTFERSGAAIAFRQSNICGNDSLYNALNSCFVSFEAIDADIL
jgi:hypothetical protein